MTTPIMNARGEVRVFGAAGKYVQGPGALDLIGEYAATLGTQAVVLIDALMFGPLEPRIAASLRAVSIDAQSVSISAEVTEANIDAYLRLVNPRTDFVVGVGGGKTIDIAKGVAVRLAVPVVTVPTIASNDSPASRAIAIYDENHQLASVPLMDRNPVLVVVDSQIVAGAPPRFLAAGIGDALSKHFEVEACIAAGAATMQGTRSLRIAAIIAAGCYKILRENAVIAIASMEASTIDQAFEDTVEAVVLLSGLSFENGGLSIAHAVTRGLMAVPSTSRALHGEQVSYGLLVQLALADESDEMMLDMAAFLGSVGLPDSLRAFDCDASPENYHMIAQRTLTAPHVNNFPATVDRESLIRAMWRVERLSHLVLGEVSEPLAALKRKSAK